MAMDNRWNMSVDPTGGCTDADGNACVRPESGSTVLDGGGNSWSHDGESWNLETPMVLDQIIISTNEDKNLIYGNTWTKGAPQFMENGQNYQFDEADLKIALNVLENGKRDFISNEIRKRLKDGLFNNSPTPLSQKTYYLWYGHTVGNLQLVDSYIMMADMVTSYSNAVSLRPKPLNIRSVNSVKPTIRVSGVNRVVHTGTRGGKYYINANGNKSYIK